MPKKKKTLTAATMGPGKERFAVADLRQPPADFVRGELAKRPAKRFEAICFDVRRAPAAEVVEWIRGLDAAQDAADVDPKNSHGYYIRRVIVVNPRARLPKDWLERPDITCLATTDPADGPTIYRRHLTEQFEGVLSLFGPPPKPRRKKS